MKQISHSSNKIWVALFLILFFLANTVTAHVDPDIGLDEIELELKAKPNDVPLLNDKAYILMRMKRLGDAQAVIKRVGELETTKSNDTVINQIMFNFLSRDVKKAFELSDWGIEKFPYNYDQWYARARLSMKSEENMKAIEAFRKCLKLDAKRDLKNYINLTNLLTKRNMAGDKDKALSVLEEGIANFENPNDSSQLLKMSLAINKELKRYNKALKVIERLEKDNGKQISYALRRAEILELAGRNMEAIGAYDTVITMLDVLQEKSKNKRIDDMKIMYKKTIKSLQEKNVVQSP